MLQVQTLPASPAGMLWTFRWCFTEPSYRTFTALLAGMVAQPGRRTVCGMLTGAGLSRLWHHSRAHWFLSHARWSTEQVGLVLVGLIVAGLLPGDVPVLVAVDDTLMRRSGRKVAGAAWQHDGARKAPRAARCLGVQVSPSA
jgi:SRSO17 transposase